MSENAEESPPQSGESHSIFVAVFVHASINGASALIGLFPDPTVTDSDLVVLIGFAVVAIALVVATRGRLGYRAEEAQLIEPEEAVAAPA